MITTIFLNVTIIISKKNMKNSEEIAVFFLLYGNMFENDTALFYHFNPPLSVCLYRPFLVH